MRAPERILIVTKFRFMGDTVVTIPAIRAIRKRYPEAKITLLTGIVAAEALKHCPYVDSIEGFNRYGKKERFLQQVQKLREGNYDLAVLFNRSFHSAFMMRLARIPERVGFNTEGRGWLLTKRVPYSFERLEIDLLLDVAATCDAPSAGRHLELWVTDEERDHAAEKFNLAPDKTYIAIQPGANEPHLRQWSPANYAAVAARIHREMPCEVILLGAGNEADAAGALAQRLTIPYHNLATKTNLREAFGVLKHCQIFISGDTGLLHCAVGLGLRTVSIQNPFKAKRWRHESSLNRTLFVPAPTDKPDEAQLRACLNAVQPEKVTEAALELLLQPVGQAK